MNPALILPILGVVYLASSIKILKENERGIVLRLGRMLPKAVGPGLVLAFPPIDRLIRLSAGPPADAARLIGYAGIKLETNQQPIFVLWEALSPALSGNAPTDTPPHYWNALAPNPIPEGKARVKEVKDGLVVLEPHSF